MILLLLPLATAKLLSLSPYEFTLRPVPAAAQSVVNFDQARHADGRNGANLGEDLGGDFVVDVDEANGLLGLRVAPQREVGDVDLVVPEQRAYPSDHAGNVPVANVEDE